VNCELRIVEQSPTSALIWRKASTLKGTLLVAPAISPAVEKSKRGA